MSSSSMTEADRATVEQILHRVETLRPSLDATSVSADVNRQLSAKVYDEMYRAGLFGMLAPRAHGGTELHPVGFLEVIEAVSRCDSAAAWCLLMNQGIAVYAGWLPAEGAAEVYRNGPATAAGALHPIAKAERVAGGMRITGQVPFASGCHHVQWLVLPVAEMTDENVPKTDPETGTPLIHAAFVARESVTILDTWHTLGMRGTGSADVSVDDLFVPDRLLAPAGPLTNPAPGFEGPLFRMWPYTTILGISIISVAAAASVIDAAIRLCTTKTAAYNSTRLRDQQLAQYGMGKAAAMVEASRDTLYRAAEYAYDDVLRSNSLQSADAKIRLQLAASFATEACADAIRLVNDVVGSSSIRTGQPYERHFRDAHTLLQHACNSTPRYASAGRLMFGLENDWLFLSF